MRSFAIGLLVAALFVSAASAEMLITANPIGQGKVAFLAAGMNDSNYFNAAGSSLSTYGGYVGYGINDKLDVFGTLGSATVNNPGALGAAAVGITSFGANLKYAVMSEKDMPVSVAVGAGYKSMTMALTTIGTALFPLSQASIGVGVSKMMSPFVPYGAVTYRSTKNGSADLATQLDLTVGTAFAWSAQNAVLVEYTNQAVTPKVGSNYTSGQIALGVAYMM
jgi:hypothetical protein